MLRSLMAKLKMTHLYNATFSATAATLGVDNKGYGSLMLVVSSGAMAYSGTDKVSLTVQHSDTDGSYEDCAATDIFEPEAGAVAKILDAAGDASAVHVINYIGSKRFVRLNMVEAGTVSANLAVAAVQGHPELAPVY